MRSFKQRGWTVLCTLAMAVVATACGRSEGEQLPEALCGTKVDRALLRPLLTSTDDLAEVNQLDRSEAISAPCTLYSDGKPVLRLHFYYSDAAPGLAGRSEFDPIFEDVSQWRPVNIAEEAIVGRNGAIVSGPCIVGRNTHLIVELHLPEVRITDERRRKDIDKFMRVYFPATVKTLSCA